MILGEPLKKVLRWFFTMTEEDRKAADALGMVLTKDLVFRLLIELTLASLYIWIGEVWFAAIWLSLIIPAEFGEIILQRLKSYDPRPGNKYLYGQFFISLYGGGTWAAGGIYLWSTGEVFLMASGLLMIVGVTSHVTFKYSEWIKGAIVAAIAPLAALITLMFMPLPIDETLPERLLIIFGTGGLIYYMLVVAVADIQKQIALKQALDAASEASRTKSIFLANMSHEIRTPMNGVLGMADMLDRTQLDGNQKEMLSVIRSSGDALIGVIDDILDLSKIEAGHLELHDRAFWLHDLVQSLIVTAEMSANEKGLEFRCIQTSKEEHCLRGDSLRMRQVVGNLLSNAIKFTDYGAVTLTVEAIPVDDGAACALTFAVADTGSGLDSDEQLRIFEPFVQVDDSLSRRHGGSGLGLSISHHFARMMRGSIGVRSKKGEGAEFTFSCELPVVEDCDIEDASLLVEIPEDVHELRGRKPHILVAEDHAHNRRVLELMLGTMSVDVTYVTDGRQAVEACERDQFDLLLMDIQMPELTGVEALQIIRRRDDELGRISVPALALTANAMKHQVEEYKSAGFDGHVAKPIVVEALVQAINRELDRASKAELRE